MKWFKKRRNKPVFIHVSKNAGNSIIQSAGTQIINAGHRTAVSWLAEHGSKNPLFAVIRNPYDRVVSEYFYRKQRFEHGENNAHLANLNKSFDEWVLATFGEGELCTRDYFDSHGITYNRQNMIGDTLIWFISQTSWLGLENNELLVEHVLRFENLEFDWAVFRKNYGLVGDIKHHNASPRNRDYRDYYSDKTREKISAYYADDFDVFGYTF